MRIPTIFLSLLLFSQVNPVSGQDPQILSSDTETAAEFDFEQLDFGIVREGYLTLKWTEVPGTQEYRVVDDEGVVMYRGAVPVAFISGLSDGQYSFGLQALDADGVEIASGANLATATVQHWPLTQAFLLMGIGFCIFAAVVIVIVRGAWSTSFPRGGVLHGTAESTPASSLEKDTA